MKKLFFFVIYVGLHLSGDTLFAQQNQQEQLEQKRQKLRIELQRIRNLKADNKAKQVSVLEQVQSLNSQIDLRSDLISANNQQANLITRNINSNYKKIKEYESELTQLKKDYAQMVRKSYVSRSQQSRVMFLLSSESFLQAYKRLQYMSQYTKHRKEQGSLIIARTAELKSLNQNLENQKNEKERLIVENRTTAKKLKEAKVAQQRLMDKILKKQGDYAMQIQQKEKEAKRIDRQIEKLIREAIAKANKKVGKTSKATFALTAEAKVLAKSFTTNKGKLPWPVVTGKVVKKFGKQPHPTIPNITINNSGVEIETKAGERARAIFKGEVSTIKSIKGAGKLVQIRHGNYISTYYNLENITVKEGQKVDTKDYIGQVRTNPTNGRAIVKFLIYQNSTRLNPQDWIYKM